MIVTPDIKHRIGKLITAIHPRLLFKFELLRGDAFELQVYFEDEGVDKGVTIQEMVTEGFNKPVQIFIAHFLRGKLDKWLYP